MGGRLLKTARLDRYNRRELLAFYGMHRHEACWVRLLWYRNNYCKAQSESIASYIARHSFRMQYIAYAIKGVVCRGFFCQMATG